jgi:hypothetical protein
MNVPCVESLLLIRLMMFSIEFALLLLYRSYVCFYLITSKQHVQLIE